MKFIFYLLLVISPLLLSAQLTDTSYTPLKCHGEVPTDFFRTFEDRLSELDEFRPPRVKLADFEEFKNKLALGLDEILNSGQILFGDTITKYISSISKKILIDQPEIYGKLRFYTLLSNEVNAFVTADGMVFVTIGLIAKLENVNQLAFVLAHEISHFTSRHTFKEFEFKNQKARTESEYTISDNIQSFSNFSKELELEADRTGLKLYLKSPFGTVNPISTFDILLKSKLPFHNEEYSCNSENSDLMHIPCDYYKTTIEKIDLVEDYDDEYSTHPNIFTRKNEINKILPLSKFVNLESKNSFDYVHNVARFERQRIHILNFEIDKCLYEIDFLKSKFPLNNYLNLIDAYAWNALGGLSTIRETKKVYQKPSRVYGEMRTVNTLLNELSGDQIKTIALRKSIDLNRIDNSNFRELEIFAFKNFAQMDGKLEYFKDLSYSELSYGMKEVEGLDSTSSRTFVEENFHLYLLPDVVKHRWAELKKYESEAIEFKKNAESDNSFSYYSRKVWKKTKAKNKYEKLTRLNVGLGNAIFIEPRVSIVKKSQNFPVEAIEIEKEMLTWIDNLSTATNFKADVVSRHTFNPETVDLYNAKSYIYNQLVYQTRFPSIKFVPVDIPRINNIKETFNTNKVVFLRLEHNQVRLSERKEYILPFLYSGPGVLCQILKQKAYTYNNELSIIILDIEDFQSTVFKKQSYIGKPNELVISNYLFDIFTQLQRTK